MPPADSFNQNGTATGNIEGPVWIDDALYLSEFQFVAAPPSRILKITANGTVSVAIPDAGTNGLAVDIDDHLVGCNHGEGAVIQFDLDGGTPSALVQSYNGARFNSPNDLALRSDGTLYFSDPDYQKPNGPDPQSATRVYRVAPGSSTAVVVDDTLQEPNGVTLSPDESTLYVTSASGLFAYSVFTDGSVGPSASFGNNITNGDGMVVDCSGNLYVAAGTDVIVLAPTTGVELGRFSFGGQVGGITNVAFGGPNHTTLYITASGNASQRGLFEVDVGVVGLPY